MKERKKNARVRLSDIAAALQLPMREKIFQENLKRIVAHNARGATWTEAVNKFTDMAADEVPKGLNQAMLFQQKTRCGPRERL